MTMARPPWRRLIGDYDPAYYLFVGRTAIRVSVNDRTYYSPQLVRTFSGAGDLLERFRQLGACHFVQDPMIGGPERLYSRNLIQALKSASPHRLTPIYVDGGGAFAVYRIPGCAKERSARAALGDRPL